ncbi:MAG TPA: glycoside hydrolase family 2 TIM barrel-domain containing protein [Terriglobia bacterium]|nr:glycoside hydrolase family 2 TIM barrel-domain containing protein [Terriglobia bacterium]
MSNRGRLLLILLVATSLNPALAKSPSELALAQPMLLKEDWRVQTSKKVGVKGENVSTIQYRADDWYPASVPSTVLNCLIENKVYPDPYYGMNLRLIPGMGYPIGENFSNLSMPLDSPFVVPWWYRKEFRIPASYEGMFPRLHFDGINFRANIWLNGVQIADNKKVAGSFRLYEFDISPTAKYGRDNVLAVEIFPAQADDLGITWVDVNPCPPDKNMGLWRQVYLTASGPVVIRYPHVVSRLELPSLTKVHLTVTAELQNASSQTVHGRLKGQIEDIHFDQEVEIEARKSKVVTFTPDRFPQLDIARPRVWWPAQFGPQNLYKLVLGFEADGKILDRQQVRFGVRDVSSELSEAGHRIFKVNGKKILVRGAGWWSDMLLRSSPERQEWEIRYFRDMNLNVLRMDGKFEDENFLNMCDRYGLLLMPGWCCCDHWEKWDTWKEEDYTIAVESLRDRLREFRNHPSVLAWLNGDDNPPPPKVERAYIEILKENQWPVPFLSSATAKPSTQESTGLKMTGPYDYVPPSYWLVDKEHGGAFGFITETSPCPLVPPVESLKKFIPKDHLWPIDEYWDYHAGGGVFKDIKLFQQALNTRYGTASDLSDFVMKAQLMAYEGERAMYEAYGRNKYHSTGVLHEMLNNAWPSLIWNLYDFYLRPAGAYFGTKKACEPLHIQYSFDDRSVFVVNSVDHAFKSLIAKAEVWDLKLNKRFSKEIPLDVPLDSSTKVVDIPELQELTTTYFIYLTLQDSGGTTVSTNLYWLSTKLDVLDEGGTTWYYTPARSMADLTELRPMPTIKLKVTSRTESHGDENLTRVTVENPGPHLAFFIRLQVRKQKEEEEVLPVLWSDNYFSLMPGERREYKATYPGKELRGASPLVQVAGWNVADESF